MIVSRLINFNQHTIATFWMNKNYLTTVRARCGRIRQKLVALGLQQFYIVKNIVGTETDMVNATFAIFLKVFGNRAFAIEWMHQLNLRAFNREKCSSGFSRCHIFLAGKREAEIFHKAFDGFFEIGNGNSDMVKMRNHRCLNENGKEKSHKGGGHFSGMERGVPVAIIVAQAIKKQPKLLLGLHMPDVTCVTNTSY